MQAFSTRNLSVSTIGLAVAAAAAAYGALGTAPSERQTAAAVDPIPGLSCGWQGNPCTLPELIVTASTNG